MEDGIIGPGVDGDVGRGMIKIVDGIGDIRLLQLRLPPLFQPYQGLETHT